MRVVGIIPARGGSKGVPRKNIKLLAGKPLLQYTAESALAATRLGRVLLSTEDDEIASVGRSCGLEVPFERPAELARDDTPTLQVVQHALKWLEASGDVYDAICLLQPTNPMRSAEDIDGCVDLLESTSADSVFTVLPVPDAFNPHWVYLENEDGTLRLSTGESDPIPRRQLLQPAFHREGAVYVTRWRVISDGNSLYGKRVAGYAMDPSTSVNIDSPEDWDRAERLLSRVNDVQATADALTA